MRTQDDHTGYPLWADTAGKQAAVRAFWRHEVDGGSAMFQLADKLDEIFGIPGYSDTGKFWHVPPGAGLPPKWVEKFKAQGSEHIWHKWIQHAFEPDELIAILKQYGWYPE